MNVADVNAESIHAAAAEAAMRLAPAGAATADSWQHSWTLLEKNADALFALIAKSPTAADAPVDTPLAKDAWNWLKENPRTIKNAIIQVDDNIKNMGELPHVHGDAAGSVPRVVAVSQDLLTALGNAWSEANFAAYLRGFQQVRPLQSREVWAIPAALKMAMLQRLMPASQRLLQGEATEADVADVPSLMRGLQALGVTAFPRLLERLLPVESALRQDATYVLMDAASRDRYRNAIAHMARRADVDELRIASAAIDLARSSNRANAQASPQANNDPRIQARRAHVGYYLVAEGRDELLHKVGYHPMQEERLRGFLHRYATDFYIAGIWLLTLLLITLLMVPLLGYTDVLLGLTLAFLLTILPASQGAVETMNHIVAALFPAEALPKFDFSEGIPAENATLVTVPTLLLNEAQTRQLIADLEVRFLANKDPHLHFALVTDLPDSSAEPGALDSNELVNLAAYLIAELNQQYARQRRRLLLSVAPPSHLQCAPGRLDGLGAEARQAA